MSLLLAPITIFRYAAQSGRYRGDSVAKVPKTWTIGWKGGRDTRSVVKRRRFSSAAPPVISRVPISTRIDTACLFHERLQPRLGHFAIGDVPQCPRPLAGRFVVDASVTRASYHRGKWIGIFVKRKAGKFVRMPQKRFGLSPHFVMFNDGGDRC